MGDETHVNEDFHSESPIEKPGPTFYGVFSGSHHFTVAGGTFTNATTNNYHAPPTVPSDVRRIPMGDIDLRREIHLDKHSGVADYQRERHSVRRVYSAKIDRGKSSVTVAMYQGEKAEEEWRRDVAKYIAVRHPNIVQLCGTASSGNIHATVFHDDLIPFQNFVELHQHSHLSTVYIYAYIDVEFQAVRKYFASTFQHWLSHGECTFFLRRPTGRICVDLAPGNIQLHTYYHLDQRSDQPEFKWLSTGLEAAALDLLTLEEYHGICYQEFSVSREVSVYNPITVNLDAVISCSSGNQLEDLVEIAFLPRTDFGFHISRWNTANSGVVMENGWTRLSSSDAVAKIIISLSLWLFDKNYWFSQANHIFSHLGISSNFEDYVVLDYVQFCLDFLPTTAALPKGFLFLCPPEDFRIGPSSFKWPECPAYWSLDPFGADPLSWEDAANLSFLPLRLSTDVSGRSWDASVYAGIRQFHEVKGFDPDSQDVALHLGHLPYELPSEIHVPFAHIDNENFCLASDGDELTRIVTEEESGNISQSTDMNDAEVSTFSLTQGSGNSGLGEEIPVSGTFTFVLVVQWSLILCLILFWLYDWLWILRFE